MGGKSSSGFHPREYGRNEECVNYLEKEFWLSKNEISRFHSIFLKIHNINPQYEFLITIDTLLGYFNLESNVIHNLVFGWLSTEKPLTFSFVEFVIVISCFLTLRENDFGKFLFVLIDDNQDGVLEYAEVRDLIDLIKRESTSSNGPLMNILAKLNADAWNSLSFDGTVTMSYFTTLYSKHTSLSHPFRQLKCDLRRKCLGESYWNSKERLMLLPKHRESYYSDASKFSLIALDVKNLLLNMSSNGVHRYKPVAGARMSGDDVVVLASLDDSSSGKGGSEKHNRRTLPTLSPAPTPTKAGSNLRATHPRPHEKWELIDTEDDFFPSIGNIAKHASMRSRNKVISRQSSHDDMLDASTNKPHRRGSESSAGLPKVGSARDLRAVTKRAVTKTSAVKHISAGARTASQKGGQLAPISTSPNRKIIRRRSSDDLLR